MKIKIKTKILTTYILNETNLHILIDLTLQPTLTLTLTQRPNQRHKTLHRNIPRDKTEQTQETN